MKLAREPEDEGSCLGVLGGVFAGVGDLLSLSWSLLYDGVWQNLCIFQEKPEVQVFLSNLIFKCWQLTRIYNSYVPAGQKTTQNPNRVARPCW